VPRELAASATGPFSFWNLAIDAGQILVVIGIAVRRLDAEAFAQCGHARVRHQCSSLPFLSLPYFSTGPPWIIGFSTSEPLRASASLALSALYCGCGRVVAVEGCGCVGRLGELRQNVSRLGLDEVVDDVGGDAAVVHPAGSGRAGHRSATHR